MPPPRLLVVGLWWLVSRLLLDRLHLDHVAGLEVLNVDRAARGHDLRACGESVGIDGHGLGSGVEAIHTSRTDSKKSTQRQVPGGIPVERTDGRICSTAS